LYSTKNTRKKKFTNMFRKICTEKILTKRAGKDIYYGSSETCYKAKATMIAAKANTADTWEAEDGLPAVDDPVEVEEEDEAAGEEDEALPAGDEEEEEVTFEAGDDEDEVTFEAGEDDDDTTGAAEDELPAGAVDEDGTTGAGVLSEQLTFTKTSVALSNKI
jgi:hypothetical protein